jgi:predicted GIY-YIG superfamily endonuclease
VGGVTVYLLHFDRPYRHASHYRGSSDDLPARLRAHERGQGARLLAVVRAAGIGWTLARTWPGGRERERQLKRQGGAARQCPLCGITPRQLWLPRNRDGSLSRSLIPDTAKATAGVMTSAQQAEHTALRRGAAAGRVPGVTRLTGALADDPWYTHPPASGQAAPCPPTPQAA